MKTLYKIFLVSILALSVFYLFNMDRTFVNADLQQNAAVIESHRIVISRYYSVVQCGERSFKSFGYPTTGLPCTSTAYCQDFWPHGVSFQVRDTMAICCDDRLSEAIGECGQWE